MLYQKKDVRSASNEEILAAISALNIEKNILMSINVYKLVTCFL